MMEDWLLHGIDIAILFVEGAGALIVTIGAVVALVWLLRGALRRDRTCFARARITLGWYLALGLEFQLAGDVLKTAISPTWDDIGRLAAIAAIRTALNYFLAKENKELREQLRTTETEPAQEHSTRAANPSTR